MCPTHSPSALSWKAAAAAALTKATRSEPMSAPLADVSRNDLNLNQIANATPITDVIRLPCMQRFGEARIAKSTERTVKCHPMKTVYYCWSLKEVCLGFGGS